MFGLSLGLRAARESSAQPTAKASVIGLLDAGERLEWWTAFRQQLRELGYVEGQNVAFETRFARGKFEQLPALAQELGRLKVAVIVTSGTVAAQAAKGATSTIPIVMASGASLGLVASLARPGGNVTGVTSMASGLSGKRFEVLREIFPKMSRLAVLWHRDSPASALTVRELEPPFGRRRLDFRFWGSRPRTSSLKPSRP
jgi:putative ABC transport system substrate-binding protein